MLWLFSGLFEPVPRDWRHVAMVVIAAAAVLRDLGVIDVPMPQNARQIPQDVLHRHLVRGSLQFGFELGTGVRTYISSSAPYAVAAIALLSTPGLLIAWAVGAGFGLGRAATPLARYASRRGEDWDRALARRLPLITVGSCVLVLGLCLALGLGALRA
ncbi:MAG TPA: hypothetical protein VI076_15040 [Actinopolymorphaceae bacterium]